MSKTEKTEKTENVTPPTEPDVDLSPEELAELNDMVTFVANNILNSITLNQAVTVVQQIALRDARQIVEEADQDKRKEILDAMAAAQQAPADQQPPGEEEPVSVPAPA